MIILIVIFFLFILGLTAFLLSPIELYIDTAKNQYHLSLKGITKVWLESDRSELIKIGWNVFFHTRYFHPLGKGKKTRQKTKQHKKKKKLPLGLILALLRTFELQKFWLDIDTGDYITNAKLYPVFSFVAYYGLPCHINFRDNNRLILQLRNRPIDILRSFINYKTQSHGFTF